MINTVSTTHPVEVQAHEAATEKVPHWWWRWLPAITGVAGVATLLLVADTAVLDLVRYSAYGIASLAVPGTLVYRLLRRHPHTFVEDVAYGVVTGLVLELAAWAAFSVLDLRDFVWLWPAAVMILFAAAPRLRRHWRVGTYPTRPSIGWSWALAAVVLVFTGYVYAVFLSVNPIVPDMINTSQFLDLPYQLSLAGEAKHNFPLNVPQVAGEPLHYHWFAYVHLAMTSMVGHIDLPVVTMRLMVPAICALTAIVTAVAGWRISGRRWVGVGAAVLFFVVGEFDFASAAWPPFGTQVTFVIWPSLSMTFSWVLLVPLIGVIGDLLRAPSSHNSVPPLWRPGAYTLAGLLAVASSATKASSLPVLGGGLAFAFLVVVVTKRFIPWALARLAVIVVAAQLLTTATIFAFEQYGLSIVPLNNISWAWAQPEGGRPMVKQAILMAAAFVAYLLHLQLRGAGIVWLLWERKARLETVQGFLLGGAIAGPLLHLMISGYAASWFGRAAFPFSVLLSAWGYSLVFERARLSAAEKAILALYTSVFAIGLTIFVGRHAAKSYDWDRSYGPLIPMFKLAAYLVVGGIIFSVCWFIARRYIPNLRRRGVLVLLTTILVAGAPGLVMDAKLSWGVPGGPYGAKALIPAPMAEAARWVRSQSDPSEILATNSHCSGLTRQCTQADSFWLSAYSERSVLIEGWAFAPRAQALGVHEFWDSELFHLNEDAFYAPTASKISALRDTYKVRYLVAIRRVARESSDLKTLARLVYDNGEVAVYDLEAGSTA